MAKVFKKYFTENGVIEEGEHLTERQCDKLLAYFLTGVFICPKQV
jgi:hypothetical protein